MKRIHTETLGDKAAKVYRDSEWQEYRVRLYIRGELHAPADYHTDSKADAIETAFAMVRPSTAKAAAAPLSVRFNVAVNHIAARVLPCGFDVSANAPQDFETLCAHYHETGRVLVWNGASESTIFADAETNFAFRAWHDSKHITAGLPFTREGEIAALELQKADVRAIYDGADADSFCALLDAEIKGQFDDCEKNGGFPENQAAFARAYLADAAAALRGDFGLSAEAA
jgi:hypothetical protein